MDIAPLATVVLEHDTRLHQLKQHLPLFYLPFITIANICKECVMLLLYGYRQVAL